MVVDQRFVNNQITERVHTLTAEQLRMMTPENLVLEHKRAEKELRALKITLEQNPNWLKQSPRLRRYHNALQREKRRIGKELDARARAVIEQSDVLPLGEAVTL